MLRIRFKSTSAIGTEFVARDFVQSTVFNVSGRRFLEKANVK